MPANFPHRTLVRAAAAAWGLAEATLFFILPDVYLTRLALREGRHARRETSLAVLLALLGALAGGALMYWWGSADPDGARGALARVPAISSEMIERVGGDLEVQGLGTVVLGPSRGTPYKIYAVQSGRLGIPLALFLAVSVPARFLRFALLTALAWWLAHRTFRNRSPSTKRWIHAAVWLVVYAAYFWKFGV